MRNVAQECMTATSKLFSSAVLQELARKGRSPLFASLVRKSDLQQSIPCPTHVGDVFQSAFSFLKREGFRDEYVYKSALVRRILLGRHSLRTATVLTEFRVAECKADVAILNGTSTVYEIKSERDSLLRLDRQLNAYKKVFARVYVVAAENHLENILKTVSDDVGIMRLNDRFQISTLRESIDSPDHTSPISIFDSIRTEEAQKVLRSMGILVPEVPNTILSSVLRERFEQLSPRAAHDGMVEVLKRTRAQSRLSELLDRLPSSLHTAALTVPLRKSDHGKLVAALDTRLEDAMTWG